MAGTASARSLCETRDHAIKRVNQVVFRYRAPEQAVKVLPRVGARPEP
jgi:hypothetical protein